MHGSHFDISRKRAIEKLTIRRAMGSGKCTRRMVCPASRTFSQKS
ncbi:hypothetical protein BSLA_03f0680 [Burkholderia stabilis]|nr:hypothetical protein BSLA_03f0680 [Burkholderia stabilis]